MSGFKPVRLRCEYLENPLGLETPRPRLGWWLQVPVGSSDRQAAYQVRVTDDSGVVMWDSGKVFSHDHNQIAYAGRALAPKSAYQWRVRVWNAAGRPSAWSAPASWSMGLFGVSSNPLWVGADIGLPWNDKESQPATYLRKSFQVRGKIVRAVAYVSALGLYEMRLNGKRVGDQLLAPEWTDYSRHVQYQTYDVTRLLRRGENTAGAILGPGWYAGRLGLAGPFKSGGEIRGVYGRHLRFFCRLELQSADGTTESILSDDSWRYSVDGPVRGSDLLDGETYDARREMHGWDRPGFSENKWEKVTVSQGPQLNAQINEPIKQTETLQAIRVTKVGAQTHVFDLGQNMVGWVRIRLKAPAGRRIVLHYGEVLNEDGTVHRTNLRGAAQEDVYIAGGRGRELFEPRFTYHGFRYVEVKGLTKSPSRDDLIGVVVHSSSPPAGTFSCSSDLLTRLMRAIQWTQRDNMHSTPTDCPQRDERLGWMGDIQVFSQTACFNMDMAAFFTKWLRDVREAQAEDGRFPDFAPHPFSKDQRFTGNAGWGDAGVIVPWRAYVNYRDKQLLADSFPSVVRWIDFIRRHNPDLIWRNRQGTDLVYGDWLNGDTFKGLPDWPATGGEVPKEIYATSFFAYTTEIVARMARVLGRKKEAASHARLARAIRQAYVKAFVGKDGRIKGDTQAGYALALHFDLLPLRLRPRAARHMVRALRRYGGSMSTGIQSTVQLMLELTRFGYHREAFDLINKTTMPSWGYMIQNGGTTIWERWDGWVKGRGFQDPGMNSFNHYAIGAVGEWMWKTIIGLHPDEEAPGWQHFFLKPIPGGGLTSARRKYDSIQGPIEVEWHIKNSRFILKATIPPNATATVCLPGGNETPRRIGAGIHRFSSNLSPEVDRKA